MRIFRTASGGRRDRGTTAGGGGDRQRCLIRRCLAGDVEVAGIARHSSAHAAIAGRRPRDPSMPWRETPMRVRLVREPDDPDDPNRIAVLTMHQERIGDVDRRRAIRIAPAIDRYLAGLRARPEFADYALEICCTAIAWAEWDPTAAADAEPAAVGVTLLIDDRDLGFTLAVPELPALV
jgi:hypothetical protein